MLKAEYVILNTVTVKAAFIKNSFKKIKTILLNFILIIKNNTKARK